MLTNKIKDLIGKVESAELKYELLNELSIVSSSIKEIESSNEALTKENEGLIRVNGKLLLASNLGAKDGINGESANETGEPSLEALAKELYVKGDTMNGNN